MNPNGQPENENRRLARLKVALVLLRCCEKDDFDWAQDVNDQRSRAVAALGLSAAAASAAAASDVREVAERLIEDGIDERIAAVDPEGVVRGGRERRGRGPDHRARMKRTVDTLTGLVEDDVTLTSDLVLTVWLGDFGRTVVDYPSNDAQAQAEIEALESSWKAQPS